MFSRFCGERGIRTPGPVTDNGFQDRRIRPLCHFSRHTINIRDCGCKYKNFFKLKAIKIVFFEGFFWF